jgi:hypothetical protein
MCRLGAQGDIGVHSILEASHAALPAGSDPTPLLHMQNVAEEVRQDVEVIEAAHVARGVDTEKERGGLRQLRQAMEVFRHGPSR